MGHDERGPVECGTRSRVMKAALEEFTLCGYKGTSTKRIAERAGVNEVTIFRHFGSKLELFRAASEQAFRELSVPTLSEEHLKLPLRDCLSKMFYEYLERAPAQTDIFMLGMSESFAHPQIAEIFNDFAWQNRVNLAECFRQIYAAGKLRETNFGILAHVVLSSLYSLVLVRHRAPEKINLEITEEGVVNALIAGIACAYGTED